MCQLNIKITQDYRKCGTVFAMRDILSSVSFVYMLHRRCFKNIFMRLEIGSETNFSIDVIYTNKQNLLFKISLNKKTCNF